MQLTNPLKTKKNECEYYETKYFIFAAVIDMLSHKMIECTWEDKGNLPTMTFMEIRESLSMQIDSDLVSDFTNEQINLWISELSWMCLITRVSDRANNSVIQLTEKGYEAYQNQVFHSISANLIEARASRKLAKEAVIISVISISLTLLGALIGVVL